MRLALFVLVGLMLGFGARGEAAELPFRVGAAAVKITPSLERTVYLAGFDNNRRATGVHDDLYARAMVIERGGTRVALVALDLIGLSNRRIHHLKKQIHAVPAENVVIACTHVHSGPDTMGLWGKTPLSCGRDERYMEFLDGQVALAVEGAARALRPARLVAGVAPIGPGIQKNSREPIVDPDVHALQFLGADNHAIATLIHFGCHPETMTNSNRQVTADFPGVAVRMVEARCGGTAVFFNGALGGMVTVDVKEHSFAEVARIGQGVGAAALAAVRSAQPVAGDRLSVRRKTFRIPGDNELLHLLLGLNVIEGNTTEDAVITEVARIDVGEVRMVTVPGEVLPRPALELKPAIGGPAPLILALGEDELGYIVHPADWGKKMHAYERSMSVGPQAWPRILKAARELLEVPANPPSKPEESGNAAGLRRERH